MWLQRYTMVLELSAAERDRALLWLIKNHAALDCKIEDASDGGASVRVRDQDAPVLPALAKMRDATM